MAGRRKIGVERRKSVCAKEQSIKDRNNLIAP